MLIFNHRAIDSVRPLFFLFALILAGTTPLRAQKLYHADQESKTVFQKKMRAVRKSLYYTKGGNLNIRWNAGLETYYSTTSPFGFTTFYYPASNEKVSVDPEIFSARDELLYVFAQGGGEDLGLTREGFVLKSSKRDGEYIVRTYEPSKPGSMCARAELALNGDYLPVFCAYYDKKGRVITKTYLSKYTSVGGFAFPTRVTEVSWLKEKADSTVRLDIYSNLQVDVQDPMHVYQIPPDAVSVDMHEGLKSLSKSAK